MHRPVRHRAASRISSAGAAAAKQGDLAAFALALGGLRAAQDAVGILHQLAPVGIETVEGARPRQILEGPLVDQPRIDPAGEIGQRFELPARLAHLHHMIHRLAAHALHRRQGIEHRVGLGIAGEHRFADG